MYAARCLRSTTTTPISLVSRRYIPARGVATLPSFSLEGKTCVGMSSFSTMPPLLNKQP